MGRSFCALSRSDGGLEAGRAVMGMGLGQRLEIDVGICSLLADLADALGRRGLSDGCCSDEIFTGWIRRMPRMESVAAGVKTAAS